MFRSERLAPLSVAGYQRMVARAGKSAGFPFLVPRHMCDIPVATSSPMTARTRARSSTTWVTSSINSTVRYTALAPLDLRASGKIEDATKT